MNDFNSNLHSTFNLDVFLPTFMLFVFGLGYYYYKYRNVRRNIEENNVGNINQNVRSEDQNNQNSQNLPPSFIQNDNANSDLINQQNETDILNEINIHVMMMNQRKVFTVNKSHTIRNFIQNTLKSNINNINANQNISLICAGRRLDEEKRFCDYSIISNDTVIHCFLTNFSQNSNHNQNSNNNNYSNSSIHPTYNYYSFTIITNPNESDENSVHLFTLIFHFISLISFFLITLLIRFEAELLSGASKFMVQVLFVIWILQAAKSFAKVYIFKKIVYN